MYENKDGYNTISLSCSEHDKLVVLWILNRQAKIFLRIRMVIVENKNKLKESY